MLPVKGIGEDVVSSIGEPPGSSLPGGEMNGGMIIVGVVEGPSGAFTLWASISACRKEPTALDKE